MKIRLFILFLFLLCQPGQGTNLPAALMEKCASDLKRLGRGTMLVISTAGRMTGKRLPGIARALEMVPLHVHPAGLATSVTSTFPHADFAYPSIEITDRELLTLVGRQISKLAQRDSVPVAGVMAGMDYGVPHADGLSHYFGTPGNSVADTEWRTDKLGVNQRLADLQIPVARTQALTPEELLAQAHSQSYPLFVKPAMSWGSIGAGAFENAGQLQAGLQALIAKAAQMNHSGNRLVVQEVLERSKIYFVDSINYVDREIPKRIITGVWLDSRGDDFPKEVWDLIVMFPPPGKGTDDDADTFKMLVAANDRTLTGAKVTVGSAHLEFMARDRQVSHADGFLPTDLNLRLPGLDAPGLETRATNMHPYILDIASRTFPELLNQIPPVYSNWNEYVALVFLRAPQSGVASAAGLEWIESLKKRKGQPGQAYVVNSVAATGAVSQTIDGDTMQGVFHVAGPTRAAIQSLYEEIREKERNLFFIN